MEDPRCLQILRMQFELFLCHSISSWTTHNVDKTTRVLTNGICAACHTLLNYETIMIGRNHKKLKQKRAFSKVLGTREESKCFNFIG